MQFAVVYPSLFMSLNRTLSAERRSGTRIDSVQVDGHATETQRLRVAIGEFLGVRVAGCDLGRRIVRGPTLDMAPT